MPAMMATAPTISPVRMSPGGGGGGGGTNCGVGEGVAVSAGVGDAVGVAVTVAVAVGALVGVARGDTKVTVPARRRSAQRRAEDVGADRHHGNRGRA